MPPEDAAMFRRFVFGGILVKYGQEVPESRLERLTEDDLDLLERIVATCLKYPGYP
jgi:hypothetical protein